MQVTEGMRAVPGREEFLAAEHLILEANAQQRLFLHRGDDRERGVVERGPDEFRRDFQHGNAVAVGFELAATMQLVPSWHDSLALWQRATEVQPRAIYAHLKLGETYRAQKRFHEAASSYVRAGDVDPRSIKGPAGLLRTVGEREEAAGRIPAGTCDTWEAVIAKPGFNADKMQALIAVLDKSECRSCAEAMLWLALRMFPQSDTSLVSFARKEMDRGRADLAMVYLSEVHDPNTPGLDEVAKRVREPSGTQ